MTYILIGVNNMYLCLKKVYPYDYATFKRYTVHE